MPDNNSVVSPLDSLTVDRNGGFPRLLLDGAPLRMQPYLRSWEKYPGRENSSFEDLCRDYRAHYALGCRVFIFQATCGADFYVPDVEVWKGPDDWDYRQLDAFVDFFTRECPAAVIIPLLYIGSPAWWDEANPDELLRFFDGSCEADFAAASGSARRRVASLASSAWTLAMDAGLRRVVGRLDALGSRIGGWMFGGGITYEWGLLGSFGFIDSSSSMQTWWSAWRTRHGLAACPIPSPAARLRSTGDWRNPTQDADAIDFQRCLSDLTAERIRHFAHVIRQHGGSRPIITFYGFTLTAREGQGFIGRYGSGGFQGGHHAFRAVLDCPDIDVITSPWSYANRRLGTGDLYPHYPADSVRLAGKVSWIQDDNRTLFGFPAPGIDTGHEAELDDCMRQMQRTAARRICSTDELYRMDLLGGTWDHPDLYAAIQHLDALALHAEPLRSAAAIQVVVVVDETAVNCLALHSPLHLQNVYFQIPLLSRMGCPYHLMLLDDVEKIDPSAYRLMILALCPRNTARLRAVVERFRQQQVSIVSLPGTALVGDHGPDPEAASVIAGMPLTQLSPEPLVLFGTTDQGQRYGRGGALSHACVGVGVGVGVETITSLAAIEGRSESALSLQPRGNAYDAWAAVAPLPAQLLTELAARAGCHLVHRGGQLVWSTAKLIAIHAHTAGTFSLCPQGPWAAVRALMAARSWRYEQGTIYVELSAGETAIFTEAGLATAGQKPPHPNCLQVVPG